MYHKTSINLSYVLPRIADTLDSSSGSKIFPTLYLHSGYYQVEIGGNNSYSIRFPRVQQNDIWVYKCSGYISASCRALLTRFSHETVLSMVEQFWFQVEPSEMQIILNVLLI